MLVSSPGSTCWKFEHAAREANLGLLGLGVSEPLPSWGALLRDLENYTAVLQNPWMLAPVVLLVVVVGCLQVVLRTEDQTPC